MATVLNRAVRNDGYVPSSSREQLRDIVGVGRVLPGVARRVHARRTVERVDFEAGVVGDTASSPERVGERSAP